MSTTNESKGFYKLNWVQRIGFGSGDLAQNLIFQVICTYLLFFYTDIYGLTPSAVAVMFLVGNVANVIWDPIVGALIDKSNPRYGKYRSYLLYVGIPLSGFAILCFYNGFAPSLIYAWLRTVADICLCDVYLDAAALYIYQCALRSIELFVDTRHRRDYHSHIRPYVYGQPWWPGSELRSAPVYRPDCRRSV